MITLNVSLRRHSRFQLAFLAYTAFARPLSTQQHFTGSHNSAQVNMPPASVSSRPRRTRTHTVRYLSNAPSSSTLSPNSSNCDEEQTKDDCDYNPCPSARSPCPSSSSSSPPSSPAIERRVSKRPRLRYSAVEASALKKEEDTELIVNEDTEIADISSISSSSLTADEIETVRHDLLTWYFINHRKFPWRAVPEPLPFCKEKAEHQSNQPHLSKNEPAAHEQSDANENNELSYLPPAGSPYAVWVSEVMSQQTRIEVVIGYYKRWMKRFPSLSVLADSSLEQVNEIWSGLGYYRRARFLHEGAKQILELHDGHIPNDLKSVKSISGIGEYTAGAILSIAFHQDEACVDGNIERVICRLRPSIGSIQDERERKKLVWKVAKQLVSNCKQDNLSCGDLNQALMEIGATVCKPKAALCNLCPLKTNACGAWLESVTQYKKNPGKVDIGKLIAEKYPTKGGKKKTKVRNELVIAMVAWKKVHQDNIKVLTVKRGKGPNGDNLLTGLWEVVNVIYDEKSMDNVGEVKNRDHPIWERLEKYSLRQNDVQINSLKNCGKVVHIFSHIKQQIRVFAVRVDCSNDNREYTDDSTRWISVKDIGKSAVSTQMKKVITKALTSIDDVAVEINTDKI